MFNYDQEVSSQSWHNNYYWTPCITDLMLVHAAMCEWPVLYSCNVARCDHKLPDVTIWQLMWPDVAESDQKPFFDKSVTFWHFATISCNLWPGVARSDQQRADIVLPVVPKSCQVWPGVARCDQIKASVTSCWGCSIRKWKHVFVHILSLKDVRRAKTSQNNRNIASVWHV